MFRSFTRSKPASKNFFSQKFHSLFVQNRQVDFYTFGSAPFDNISLKKATRLTSEQGNTPRWLARLTSIWTVKHIQRNLHVSLASSYWRHSKLGAQLYQNQICCQTCPTSRAGSASSYPRWHGPQFRQFGQISATTPRVSGCVPRRPLTLGPASVVVKI